jgi:CubicO group peptidase (beta-lactamase class C family)
MMRKLLALFACLCALGPALRPTRAAAQVPTVREIDNYIKPFADANQFSGVVLAARDGRVIYEKAFGLADADFKIPNRADTRFGIASITKLMTVVILNRLVGERKIAPEDRLSKFIPDFPNGDKITIQLLRSHRSGIPHRVMRPEEESLPYTSAEFVERVKAAKLAFEPGAQRLYSSAGYAVLARALEIASGKPYAQLLREYVFAPAGMTDSLDFDGETIMERRSQDYLLESKGVVNAALKDYSFLVGAGSVYSTARDVHKFGEAVLDGKYGEASRAALVRDSEISGNGMTNGHRAYFKINRAKKWGFVFVSNLNSGANDMVQAALESILDGRPTPAPAVPAPKIIPNPNKSMSDFLGHYARADGSGSFEVNIKNDILRAGDVKLYPTGVDRFFEYRFFGDVQFVRDAAGRVREIKWASPGVTSTWVRQ